MVVQRRREWNDGFLFDNAMQHDANEAFVKLLDTCNDLDYAALRQTQVGMDVQRSDREAFTTPFWQIFGSRVCERTTCSACGKISTQIMYRNLFTVTLPSMGDHYLQPLFMDQLGFERLGDDTSPDVCTFDPAYPALGGCLAQHRRHKETVIEHSAPVLVLHLLRFTWNHHLQRPEKLQTRVNFDVELPPIGDAAPYDLRAVIEHRGRHPRSSDSGHYTAYVRDHDWKWYHCNDSFQPRPCDLQEVF